MSSSFSKSTIEVRQLSICGFRAASCSSWAAISTGAGGGRAGDGDGAGVELADAGGGMRGAADVGAAVALPMPSFERIVPNSDMCALLAWWDGAMAPSVVLGGTAGFEMSGNPPRLEDTPTAAYDKKFIWRAAR
jgi:hypothetical protein